MSHGGFSKITFSTVAGCITAYRSARRPPYE
jgi:hypothetical protein